SEDVQAYVSRQIDKEPLADDRFREALREFTVDRADVDLARPTESNSGRYWYNLHVVLVMQDRQRMNDLHRLRLLRDRSLQIADKKGYVMRTFALVPDHLHMALRGNIENSPEELA